MKNFFYLILIAGLICLINLSGFTNLDEISHDSGSPLSNFKNIRLKAIYSKGYIPIKIGMPDTLTIVLSKDPGSYAFRVRIYILDNNLSNVYDTTYHLNPAAFTDTTLMHQMPRFYTPKNDIIIVEALPGTKLEYNLLLDTIYDTKQYCQNITYDTYNYADPCKIDTGGFGFTGRRGNIVAGFRNNDFFPVAIGSVEQSFFDTIGGGLKPYNIVIYGDNINSKPGALLFKSPILITPPGTGTVNRLLPYQIDTMINIPPFSRFYVGYRQFSIGNIKAAYQNENPVRSGSFFFTSPDTASNWFDFSDSAKNNRMDIAPVLGNSILRINFIMQGFYNSATNKLSMRDTIRVYLRQPFSPYNISDSAIGKLDSVNLVRSFGMSLAIPGSYYIEIKHRNTIETWSNFPVSIFPGGITAFNFTSSSSQAYGNNELLADLSPLRFAAYSGDVNQDGTVDLSDLVNIFNDVLNFVTGYANTDLNGDNISDLTDLILCYNNVTAFVMKITPP